MFVYVLAVIVWLFDSFDGIVGDTCYLAVFGLLL